VDCSCCGESREDSIVVTIGADAAVKLCRYCLEWQLSKVGVTSTPTLPVADLAAAVELYEAAGFGVRVHEDIGGDGGEGFAFVDRDGQSVFDLDAVDGLDPDSNAAGCYIISRDADEWYARLVSAGLPVTALQDEPWGMREFTLRDPSGNRVRIGRPTGD
jgi:catechol 2,3-dioxygenase-like lactoylglutathione lyase family enzyme